ncbi:hypothetical protein AVV36_gp187 [Pectobacterium bacteriophage PM2]|uniref:Phage protein n=1 Tax=Pectobacterium bacteriophage PM2 TaxID=1429794 RepID=A0A0A0Q0Y1_9CAUD|nr:hypothetical protein AVV36_gp187 [Pectobacterium bacteriophage PM2]AHY25223.1 hypothetical protein PM2_261 [Pectobacterium bacteriophage PM2]
MQLKRESINLDSSTNGTWNFCIYDKNPESIEKVENILRSMETLSSVGGIQETWEDYCDKCPCYEDGYGSGFWIPIYMVQEFKDAWKKAKANV